MNNEIIKKLKEQNYDMSQGSLSYDLWLKELNYNYYENSTFE